MPNFPHLFAWRKIAALDAKFVKIRMVKIRPPTTHTAYGQFFRIPKKEQQKVGLKELLVTSVSNNRIAALNYDICERFPRFYRQRDEMAGS